MHSASYFSCFSAVNKRLDTFATSAGTQYGSSTCAECNAILKFSMAASLRASNAACADLVMPFGFCGRSMARKSLPCTGFGMKGNKSWVNAQLEVCSITDRLTDNFERLQFFFFFLLCHCLRMQFGENRTWIDEEVT